jgi:hypothetical protein
VTRLYGVLTGALSAVDSGTITLPFTNNAAAVGEPPQIIAHCANDVSPTKQPVGAPDRPAAVPLL